MKIKIENVKVYTLDSGKKCAVVKNGNTKKYYGINPYTGKIEFMFGLLADKTDNEKDIIKNNIDFYV